MKKKIIEKAVKSIVKTRYVGAKILAIFKIKL